MKPVIIIAIAFVLLIPSNVFAEYNIDNICEWATFTSSENQWPIETATEKLKDEITLKGDAYLNLLHENYEDWEIESGQVPRDIALGFMEQAQYIQDESRVDKTIEYFDINPKLKPLLLTRYQTETFDEHMIESQIVDWMLHPDFYGENPECERKFIEENRESFSNLLIKVYGENNAERVLEEIERKVNDGEPTCESGYELIPGNTACTLVDSQTCEDFDVETFTFGKYRAIEDYPLISELVSQGLTEKSLENSEKVLQYKDNPLYDKECQTLFTEYKQLGKESLKWKNSCTDLGEFPNVDQIVEMYHVWNGVCGFATIVSIEESTEQLENICGTGTIEKNGICVPDYPDTKPSSKGGGCLIATATYGSELAPQVQQLRELRDNTLLNTELGSAFMESFNDFYYSFSPIIADYERENPVFREMVKIAITPMITSLSILNYVDMDSEVEVLGYGISLIILNGMMYFGIPAIVIMRIRK